MKQLNPEFRNPAINDKCTDKICQMIIPTDSRKMPMALTRTDMRSRLLLFYLGFHDICYTKENHLVVKLAKW